jgi:hypothetical protein
MVQIKDRTLSLHRSLDENPRSKETIILIVAHQSLSGSSLDFMGMEGGSCCCCCCDIACDIAGVIPCASS